MKYNEELIQKLKKSLGIKGDFGSFFGDNETLKDFIKEENEDTFRLQEKKLKDEIEYNTILRAKLIQLTDMYDDLLTRYRDSVEEIGMLKSDLYNEEDKN